MDCSLPGSSVHGDSPAAAPKGNKKSTENKSKAHVPLQPESAARSGALREANWAPSCLLNGTRCRQRPRVSAPVCHVTLSQPLPISGVLGVHELSPQCLLQGVQPLPGLRHSPPSSRIPGSVRCWADFTAASGHEEAQLPAPRVAELRPAG